MYLIQPFTGSNTDSTGRLLSSGSVRVTQGAERVRLFAADGVELENPAPINSAGRLPQALYVQDAGTYTVALLNRNGDVLDTAEYETPTTSLYTLTGLFANTQMDSNGRPLAGGRMYAFRQGSFSQLATSPLQNASGNPLPNPIILDEAGLLPTVIQADGSYGYTLVLTKADGTTVIQTVDLPPEEA